MFAGTSRQRRYIPVHRIPLSEEKRKSLLAFHAITGCDTKSQFYGVDKASAWKVFEDVPGLLEHLGEESQISADVLAKAEAFVCKLYNQGTQEVEINKKRAAAFRKFKKDLDALPPTQDALILHIKRANYQTMVWNKALEPCPSLPKPEQNGWYYSGGLLNDGRRSVSGMFTVSILWMLPRRRMLCKPKLHLRSTISLLFQACKCDGKCRNDRNTAAEENKP